jgi:EpsD family peptidyl-prolyl cis-trans isomerase
MPISITAVTWLYRTVAVGGVALLLVGCGKGGENQAAVSKGQVIAHVGNDVVTVTELENEFRSANIPADKQKQPDIVKRVLGDLVLRKYLVQQALSAKLDREPGVLLDILRAREQVLASALISRNVAAKASAIGQAEVSKYIESNPQKFADRHLISIDQITFPISPDSQAVADSAQDLKSLDEADQKLTAMNVPHNRSAGYLSSGDVPQDLLAKMRYSKRPEEVFFVRAGSNGVLLVVKGEEPRPLVGEAASNLARQLIRAELQKAELGLTSVSANFSAKYEGDYAAIMQPQGSGQPEMPK